MQHLHVLVTLWHASAGNNCSMGIALKKNDA
jgi:hypothetical protein